jgi:3alpha(or 20beta)-hydroxysteroid dehydrogenase
MMASAISGKSAIVSGAARGIGAAEARLLTEAGASVLLCDVLDAEGEALTHRLSAGSQLNRVRYQHLDATSAADWNRAVSLAERLFGRVDILINNAGVHGPLDSRRHLNLNGSVLSTMI